MKNPLTERKTKQKGEIIRQLELAYKIAEDMVKGATEANAGMHCMYNHLEAVIDSTRGELKRRVKFLQTKVQTIWTENKENAKQAYLEVEFSFFGMLVGYRGTDENVSKPLGLKASYAAVTEKMADELMKRQAETKKQIDLSEKVTQSLNSVNEMAKRLSTEINRVRSDADMQAGYAYEEGQKAAKKELGKPIVTPLPTIQDKKDE